MLATVVIIPVLGRPHRAAPVARSVTDTSDARVLFVATPGDTDEIAACQAAGADVLIMDRAYESGDYSRKINHGYRNSTEPLVFCGADDLLFHAGWLEAAMVPLADPGIGVVGTNDLGAPRVLAGLHSTHSLVTRRYADERGTITEHCKILDEGYAHNFVDDELVATAKHRGAFRFAMNSHVEHLHPSWRKAEWAGANQWDAIYALGESRFHQDRCRFEARVHLWA